MKIIAALGGQTNGYRRDRRRAVQRLVAEVYSAPRVTKTLKLMPSMGLIPGFALDLSGEDENGDSWDFTRADMRAKARALLLETKPFCCELYELQAEAGRYFLHEHLAQATSWELAEVRELLETNGVQRVVGDQC